MINIAEKLKDAPKGTKLYSPLFGEGYFEIIDDVPLIYVVANNSRYKFNSYGQYWGENKGECLLFPSKEERTWDNFSLKKTYNFKPFDKVVVRDGDYTVWTIDFFSHKCNNIYYCLSHCWLQCLPYNEKTAKLIGTTDSY